MSIIEFFRILEQCVRTALPKAAKTALWLLKIMIPVTFLVLVLDYTGWLLKVANFIAPVFIGIGLPGESAFVLLTSVFANIYSAIAVMTTIGFSLREGTILAVMCLIAHNLILETIVVKKTGSNAYLMVAVRIVVSLIAGVLLNLVLPDLSGSLGRAAGSTFASFGEAFVAWCLATFWLTIKIMVLVTLLMVLQQALEKFGIIAWLQKPLQPLMGAMGLPRNTTFSWIVANTLGLAYGAAILIEEVEQGKMTRKEADLLNHHLVISHSNLEDPLLFVAIGLPLWWLIWPRVVLAVAVVYMRRLWLRFN